jgi:hypothetical protein
MRRAVLSYNACSLQDQVRANQPSISVLLGISWHRYSTEQRLLHAFAGLALNRCSFGAITVPDYSRRETSNAFLFGCRTS